MGRKELENPDKGLELSIEKLVVERKKLEAILQKNSIKILAQPVKELGLTETQIEFLKRAKIYTIGDLAQLSIEETKAIEGIGDQIIKRFELKFAAKNIRWPKETAHLLSMDELAGNKILNSPISILKLPDSKHRIEGKLKDRGIHTIGQLANLNERDLQVVWKEKERTSSIGKKSIEHIKSALAKIGILWSPKPDTIYR